MNTDTNKLSSAQVRYLYQAQAIVNRFDDIETPEDITQEHVDQWRRNPERLSPIYVEGCIKAVSILTGRKFIGKRLQQKMRRPILVSMEHLDRVHAAAVDDGNDWFAAFLKFAYITALRLEDITRMPRSSVKFDCIEIEAKKTQKLHVIPRHPVLQFELPDGDQPLYRNCSTVRDVIARYCRKVGIPYFIPKAIRKTSITQYELARPGAGAVLQGSAVYSGHGITWRHYIDQTEVLRQAQVHLAIPPSMRPPGWNDKPEGPDIATRLAQLSPEQLDAVLKIVEALK